MNEDGSPIKNGGFPASYVSFPEGMCVWIKGAIGCLAKDLDRQVLFRAWDLCFLQD